VSGETLFVGAVVTRFGSRRGLEPARRSEKLTEGFDTADLKDAKALLEELS
jgi:hypothetical protein